MNPQDLVRRVLESSEERDNVMRELYTSKNLKQIVLQFVLRNGGSVEEAETIHTDTVINFVKNCYKREFFIHSTLENYFFGVTKNLWFRTIREKKQREVSQNDVSEMADDKSPEILLIDEERRHLLEKMLEKLDHKCREVLTLWAKSMKMQDIAMELNYSSPEVVRKKKHFCLKKLIEIVDNNPEYLKSLNQES